MPTRRIQKVGGSTYIVSLPKNWVIRNGLKEKDTINIKIKDKNLILAPEEIKLSFPDSLELKLEEHRESLLQLLYSLYYLGVNEIKITSQNSFPISVLNELEDFVSSLTGGELIYEDSKRVLISFFVSVKKLNRYQIFMRFLIILKRMITQFLEDPTKVDKIKKLEQDSDKIFHLFNRWYFEVNSGKIVEDSVMMELLPFYLRIIIRLEKLSDILSKLLTDGSFNDKETLDKVKPVFNFLLERADKYLDSLSDQVFDAKKISQGLKEYKSLKAMIETLPDKLQSFALYQVLSFSESSEKDVLSIFKLLKFTNRDNENNN